MAIRINNALRSKMVDNVTAYLSGTGGTSGSMAMLRVYSGTQPGTAGGTSGTMLVQIDSISWVAGSNGTATITTNNTGTAATTGVSAWARLSGTDGTTYVIDGNCGTSTQDFVIDIASITAEGVVTLTAATIIQPAS